MEELPKKFPLRDVFTSFIDEYSGSPTYWYIPKARALNDENVQAIRNIVSVIFEEFLGAMWNRDTQDKILKRLVDLRIVNPYRPDGTVEDRTALTRIWKKLLETLGLLWIEEEAEIVITDAGLDLIATQDEGGRAVIEKQIVKYQYPNPSLSGVYASAFTGLLPHIFLLQVLKECGGRITSTEYELFVNLAQSQDDLARVLRYIHSWRDLSEKEKALIVSLVQQMGMRDPGAHGELLPGIEPEEAPSRFTRIHQNSSYQKCFFTFPGYVGIDGSDIVCLLADRVDELLTKMLPRLKITHFTTIEDWFAYFGNPDKEPSWLTYLLALIESAPTVKEIEAVVKQHEELLTEDEAESVKRAQIEKDIETFYFAQPGLLEKGLTIMDSGRQFPTPIGRIDLLCRSRAGEYVVVEIKVQEASDSVFGQILRYIGWVHRNVEGGRDKVRGIIVASRFPETARYSRIGLLKPDYQSFLKFKRHGLYAEDT